MYIVNRMVNETSCNKEKEEIRLGRFKPFSFCTHKKHSPLWKTKTILKGEKNYGENNQSNSGRKRIF